MRQRPQKNKLFAGCRLFNDGIVPHLIDLDLSETRLRARRLLAELHAFVQAFLPTSRRVRQSAHASSRLASSRLPQIGRTGTGDYDLQYLARIIEALKVQDIAPGWIDDLIEISTRLPSRVDVRRVYRTRIFSEQDVFYNYV